MEDEQLSYPTERVVGIADDRSTVDDVRKALRSAGVEDDRIDVLCDGATGEEQGPEADSDSAVGVAIRTVRRAMGDEAQRLEHLNAAIESGAFIVQVALAEGSDDARERSKATIGRILVESGAHSVAFYGQWQIEELQLGA